MITREGVAGRKPKMVIRAVESDAIGARSSEAEVDPDHSFDDKAAQTKCG